MEELMLFNFVLEKTLESPLYCKEIQPVNPKGNQSWIFLGRTDAEAEAQYFGHLMRRANSMEKEPDTGKDWRQEEEGATEDEMVRWHHWLNVHELEQTPGESEGQGCLACSSTSWGCKELDTTQWLNNNNDDFDISAKTLSEREGETVVFFPFIKSTENFTFLHSLPIIQTLAMNLWPGFCWLRIRHETQGTTH